MCTDLNTAANAQNLLQYASFFLIFVSSPL